MNTKRILLILLALGVIGAIVGFSMWNKPHKNMASAKADVTVDAATLFNEFATDETAATAKYIGKTIAVTGQVKETTTDETGAVKVSLDANNPDGFGVLCSLDPMSKHERTTFTPGETVTFKGDCSGINFDVELARCVEVKK
jgi:hypothetical protein